ncbi:hypothetical protein ASG43_02380 [Aureimonas sp. Leaf454]|nr:hypothetical protein ASG43_02380 [Aureimonas sp. Leaf454]
MGGSADDIVAPVDALRWMQGRGPLDPIGASTIEEPRLEATRRIAPIARVRIRRSAPASLFARPAGSRRCPHSAWRTRPRSVEPLHPIFGAAEPIAAHGEAGLP